MFDAFDAIGRQHSPDVSAPDPAHQGRRLQYFSGGGGRRRRAQQEQLDKQRKEERLRARQERREMRELQRSLLESIPEPVMPEVPPPPVTATAADTVGAQMDARRQRARKFSLLDSIIAGEDANTLGGPSSLLG